MGQEIGKGGFHRQSTGPHLHFQMKKDGKIHRSQRLCKAGARNMGKKYGLSGAFVLLCALLLCCESISLLVALLLAVAIHEGGHMGAIWLCGGQVERLVLGLGGMDIRYRCIRDTYGKGCFHRPHGAGDESAFLRAGAFLAKWLPWEGIYLFCGCSALLGCFNLLPALPLDGAFSSGPCCCAGESWNGATGCSPHPPWRWECCSFVPGRSSLFPPGKLYPAGVCRLRAGAFGAKLLYTGPEKLYSIRYRMAFREETWTIKSNNVWTMCEARRYTGGEYNQVVKDKEQVDCRFALCFPELYEIAMSHLGSKILYGRLNAMEGVWCERMYAPAPDMEREMRRHGVPLYGLESKDYASEFDIFGFSLQYELNYTTVLNMLDLAGVPKFSRDENRADSAGHCGGPLRLQCGAGGGLFRHHLVGEGEENLPALVGALPQAKKEGWDKETFLKESLSIEGVLCACLLRCGLQ